MEYMPRTKWILNFFGLSPPAGEDRTYEIRQWLNMSLVFYFIVGIVLYPVRSLGDPSISVGEKIESLAIMTTLVAFTHNYVCTYYLRYDLKRLLDEVKNFDHFGEPPNVVKMSKLVDILSIASLAYCIQGASTAVLVPVFRITDCERHKEVYDTGIMCGYLVGLTYPYDISAGFLYYIHLAIEFYAVVTLATKGTIYFGIAIGLFEAIVMRLNHLVSKLREVYGDDDFDAQKARLRHCIAYHIYILDLADRVNDGLALVSMPCLVCYNFIIGMSIMAIMADGSSLSVYMTCGWSGCLFIACAAGERIVTSSLGVAEAAYDMKWYKDTRLRRDILLIILRSQRPIRFKCGNLGELSFVTFKKIIQGAYTYATMRSNLQN